MTQEEKQLLIKDLCARLPYEVQGITSEGVVTPLLHRGEADWDILTSLNYRIVKHGWKPYLRSMSSMTEEEYTEYRRIQGRNCDYSEATICVRKSLYTRTFYDDNESIKITVYYPNPVIRDWLNAHYFDYHGLIDKGLALEAPEDMYNTKTE